MTRCRTEHWSTVAQYLLSSATGSGPRQKNRDWQVDPGMSRLGPIPGVEDRQAAVERSATSASASTAVAIQGYQAAAPLIFSATLTAQGFSTDASVRIRWEVGSIVRLLPKIDASSSREEHVAARRTWALPFVLCLWPG